MLSLKIVPVTLNHLDQLQRLSVTTFKETFTDQNTNDDIQQYLKVNMSSNKLKKELSNPNCEFYFAYCNKILGGYLKLNFKNFSIGFSSENLWWGPSIRNSIMMSNNAKGFNHFTFNSNKPLKTSIGNIEWQFITGKLDPSRFTPPQPEKKYQKTLFFRYLLIK